MGIASGIRWLALGLVVATAGLVGIVGYWGFGALLEGQQRESVQLIARAERDKLRQVFVELERDIELLSRLESVRALAHLESGGGEAAQADAVRWKDRLADELSALVAAHPEYAQGRWIGVAGGGREVVRVDRVVDGVRRVPEDELQPKGDRDYFRATIALPAELTYFSEVDLNREHGEIEVPHRPMLRVARAVPGADGTPFGIVILNVEFDRLVGELQSASLGRYTAYVANERGDFLVHPDRSKTYGFDLGFEHRVQDEFPNLEALHETPVDEGSARSGARDSSSEAPERRLLQFLEVHAFPGETRRYLQVGISAAYEDVGIRTLDIALRLVAFTSAMLSLALVGGWMLSSRLSRPLRRIIEAANVVASGESPPALPVDRRDEIGTVARALDRMLASLKEKESRLIATGARLEAANADLEHFAHIASHDLREPARRVVALTDLLDTEEGERLTPDGRALIQRTQEAAGRMLDQITDFRALASIGSGVLRRETVDLGELVGTVLAENEPRLRAREVRVEVGDAPSLDVYPSLVVALYRNLIDNALGHAAEGGFTLAFTFERRDGVWVLGVRNTGSSIPAERTRLVFDAFTKLKASQRSGLGLSVCRRIAQRHSGRIWIESGADHVHVLITLTGSES